MWGDYGFYKIIKLDSQGNKLFSFGKKGKGPGEFISIGGFWVFDTSYMVYDYNAFKFISYNRAGKLVKETVIKENPANPNGSPPNIPISAVAHSPDELLIPTRGRNGSLFPLLAVRNTSFRGCRHRFGIFIKHARCYGNFRLFPPRPAFLHLLFIYLQIHYALNGINGDGIAIFD